MGLLYLYLYEVLQLVQKNEPLIPIEIQMNPVRDIHPIYLNLF